MLPLLRQKLWMDLPQFQQNFLSVIQKYAHRGQQASSHVLSTSRNLRNCVLYAEHQRYFSSLDAFGLCQKSSRNSTKNLLDAVAAGSSSGCSPRYKFSEAWAEKPVVFKTTSPPSGKQRPERSVKKASKVPRPRTKKPSRLKGEAQDAYLCTAFTTAEEYNLEHLSFDLQIQGNTFVLAEMPQDAHDILHVHLSDEFYEGQAVEEPGEMFFFQEGSVVFWNVPDKVIKQVMRIVGRHQHQPYEIALVNWENEQMNYSYHDQKTSLIKGDIMLNGTRPTDETALEKFAFSNAMVLSVKLAIWEYTLDQFVSSIENIPDNMKLGKGVKLSREEVMRKTGELFALRHRINLSSDLLISPDFYWDREELELIYNKMCQFLSVSRRTNVTNEKLNHCTELVELMRTHLDEKHSHRLEWMIIALIMVEVLFEIIHYVRLYHTDEDPPGESAT